MSLILSGSDGVSDIDGSASTPAIRGTDSNTGIFFPAADTIAFAEGGAEVARFDSSGNLGIGTSSVTYDLEVKKTVAAGNVIGNINNPSNTGAARLYLGNDSGATAAYFQVFGSSHAIKPAIINIGGNASYPLVFDTGGTERARIDSSGNFMVGTTSASAKVDIVQAANSVGLEVTATDASYSSSVIDLQASRNTTNTSYYFFSASISGIQTKIRIADSGNVTNVNGSYGTISDAKLKQDIVDASSQWDDIKNLRFRKYRLKSEVELDPNAKSFLGLVAQEAELVSPGLIEEHKDTKQETKTREVENTREIPAVLDEEGNEVEPAVTEIYTDTEEYTETVDLGTTTKSIKTSILYMKAVKALQEAMARIETLEAQNAAFETRLAALEAK